MAVAHGEAPGRSAAHARPPVAAALVVFALAIASTCLVAWQFHRTAVAKDRERFRHHVERARRDIAVQFEKYAAMLTGVAGLFAASEDVSAGEFRDYVARLELSRRFPGVQGVGWTRRVPEGGEGLVIDRMRGAGRDSFHIWPAEHEGGETHTILYLEPLDPRNSAAIGFDMSSEATRRAAMEQARDTGQATVSGRVTLVQEIDPRKQAGFLVYVPVYRGGRIPSTTERRRESLAGFVYSPFRADDLFQSVFSGESRPRLHFDVYDGSTAPENLLHSSGNGGDIVPMFTAVERIEVAGRPWTVGFRTRPDFEAISDRSGARVVLGLGVLVSAALAAVTWGQSRARVAADATAATLRGSREEVQQLLERERRHAARLREADRRKDEFLAMLAHELRNPLAPISNALQVWPLLREDAGELEKLRELMTRQVGLLIRLIDDLLDVSRISRGKIALRPQQTNLREVIDAAVEGVRPMFKDRRQSLTVALPEPPPPLMGDLTRLVQVFANLLNNASKYTPPGGRVEVSSHIEPASAAAAPAGGWVEVAIADTGEGIPLEMLEQVFEMFTQVNQTLDRPQGGLGIGLTLVKNLVELHGGTVAAESGGDGCGSTFTVRLPLATAPRPEPSTPAAAPQDAVVPPRRVLVVDDVQASAQTLALMLKKIGHETREANDGPSALRQTEEFDPHVVFCDIAMPGMDGYEVVRQIRQRPPRSGRRPLLVALTGYGQAEDRRRALEAGFDQHLVKPTSLKAIREILANTDRGVSPGG